MRRGEFRPAILGASGYIGQHFARLLARHPTFADPILLTSERSAGRRLEDVWALTEAAPSVLARQRLRAASPRTLAALGVNLVFSALPSGVARSTETAVITRGIPVFTNAADHRGDLGVPLVVPEVNPGELRRSARRPRGSALLVANPNCTATGLALGLAPVWNLLAPREVHVSTYQALSGAGLPGLAAGHDLDNVVPYIDGEEEKVAGESLRILHGGGAATARTRVLVHAARVPVRDGHLEAVTIVARRRPTLDQLRRAWRGFDPLAERALPTSPHPPVVVRDEADRPQPRLDRWAGTPARARGMAAVVGRVRWEPPYLRLFLLSHNAVRGGAGGSVLNAELALADGMLAAR
ncbi:MAG: aspartate-semialdehyde dehydrogenase [Thermoplasmata archaeon]|nr:aspartate-semialdehyde dehydrogenase [Thermoplasmata archaeon]